MDLKSLLQSHLNKQEKKKTVDAEGEDASSVEKDEEVVDKLFEKYYCEWKGTAKQTEL